MSESPREISPSAGSELKRLPLLIDLFVRLVKEKPMGTVGGVIVLLMLLTGILADFLSPYGMNEINLAARLAPPSVQHILGADSLGRDILSRIIYGARVSMIVGLSAAAIDAGLATLIGVVSGFLGGKTDMISQRFVDAFMCFPPLFLYLTIMAMLGPGMVQVILVLGVVRGIRSSRIIRSAVIGIKENIYVEAAKAIGVPPTRILYKHILPNVMAPIIIIFTLAMGIAIIAEATLSFLGFGIPPPTPSWGGMLSGTGRQYMFLAPWMCLWPGAALAIVVYGINMLGDAVRDVLDPRLRGGLGRYGGGKAKRAKKYTNVDKEG